MMTCKNELKVIDPETDNVYYICVEEPDRYRKRCTDKGCPFYEEATQKQYVYQIRFMGKDGVYVMGTYFDKDIAAKNCAKIKKNEPDKYWWIEKCEVM